MSTIAERLAPIASSIPPHVTLVAVSKTQPADAIREAYAAGQRHFGENYAQEWRAKAEQLTDLPELVWHFIGSVHTNKAKVLAGAVAWVHTVDRVELARELSKRCAQRGATLRVLLEVNIASEPQKAGCAPGDAELLANEVRSLPALELRGLMCVPPAEGDPRPHFRALRELAAKLRLPDLSMGMSGDWREAIEEGSTIVRIGTAIFGARPRLR